MKRLLYGVLLLGWIPTLGVVTGARWMAGVPLLAQAKAAPVTFTHMYTGPDGKTHLEDLPISMLAQGRGSERSGTVPVTSMQVVRTTKDYFIDSHPAPRRQYVVTISGESEVEVADGRKFRFGPGHIMLADDTTGQGHISRAVPGKERVSLFITVADGADYLK
jgi:hypothetical protein